MIKPVSDTDDIDEDRVLTPGTHVERKMAEQIKAFESLNEMKKKDGVNGDLVEDAVDEKSDEPVEEIDTSAKVSHFHVKYNIYRMIIFSFQFCIMYAITFALS